MSKSRNLILNICLSALFLTIALILPLLTGNIPIIGRMLSPMHIPVLICGLACGWQYGLVIGIVAPILRYFTFGMPTIYPSGIGMAFELGTYGVASGLLYDFFKKITKKNIIAIYATLISAMLIGRIVWGIVRYSMTLIDNTLPFNFSLFLSGAFISAWPGIILHLILIPAVVIALEKVRPLNKNMHK